MNDTTHTRFPGLTVGYRTRLLALAVCLMAVVTGMAFSGNVWAQAPAYTVITDASKPVPQLSATVGEIKGLGIMYSTTIIATVTNVLADASGNPTAVAAAYGGWFGFFQDQAVVPLDKLKKASGFLTTDIDPNTLATLPPWTAK
jgi:hypothetical protein